MWWRLRLVLPVMLVLQVSCTTVSQPEKSGQKQVVSATFQVSAGFNRPAAIDAYREVIQKEPDETKRFIARWRLASLLMEGSNVTLRDVAESVAIYQQLIRENKNPRLADDLYYQLARAYEATGKLDEAARVLGQLTTAYPQSEYWADATYRRAEIYFDEKMFDQAITAYNKVISAVADAPMHDYSLYKKGWACLLSSRHDEAFKSFTMLLDRNELLARQLYRPPEDEKSKIITSLLQDSVRAITLSFSYADSDAERAHLLTSIDNRIYADAVYESLASYYQRRQRYTDAAKVYYTFVTHMPDHEQAPYFLLKVHDIYRTAGFTSLELATKREFVERYNLNSKFWDSHRIDMDPKLVRSLKQFIQELARHYHSQEQQNHSGQDARLAEKWYREYLSEFPNERDTPELQFLLAELLYERGLYSKAVIEYEHVAYDYPLHGKAAEAGYAALQTYDKLLENSQGADHANWRDRQLDSALKFAERFPRDSHSGEILAKSARTLLDLGRQEQALVIAQKLVRGYSRITGETRIWAWLTIADSQFENRHFHDAEISYRRALDIMPPGHDSRDAVRERYALSIYRQGEAARMAGNSDDAIAAFARVGEATTNEKIVLTADYDSAALLLGAEQWDRAAGVLESILLRQPEVTQQKDIRKKLAYAYRQSGHVEKAAEEYAWLGRYADETALRTESVREAAQLYEQIKNYRKSIENYKYMLDNFTLASGVQVGTSFHIADLYRKLSDTENVRFWLDRVIQSEKNSDDRGNITDRTLAATAALQLAQPLEARYEEISLQLPLDRSLPLKKKAMEQALAAYGRAVDYDIAEISTEAIFHIAELYHDFSRAVLASPKPRGLSDIELEQYNILLEEQAYPIEEQAITIHESNIKYLRDGIYNQWITASLRQLAELMPARYDKHEVVENVIEAIN